MKKIKFSYEYKCFPIWILSNSGNIELNDLPDEIKNNKELDDKLVNLQERFDKTFIDTDTVFEAKGFKSEEEKQEFIDDSNLLFNELVKLLGSNYNFEKDKWLTK